VIDYTNQLYNSMLRDLEVCKYNQVFDAEVIECCYQVCSNCWYAVKRKLASYEFDTREDEINYFRNIKPKITSEIEYYNLLYHASLFYPPDIRALKRFWMREGERLNKFTNENKDFLHYYRSGLTHKDHLYFVRANNKNLESMKCKPFGVNSFTSTSHDCLIAYFLALEKYTAYVNKK
jgi:hypothetical protein